MYEGGPSRIAVGRPPMIPGPKDRAPPHRRARHAPVADSGGNDRVDDALVGSQSSLTRQSRIVSGLTTPTFAAISASVMPPSSQRRFALAFVWLSYIPSPSPARIVHGGAFHLRSRR